jgi:hypothetical protein
MNQSAETVASKVTKCFVDSIHDHLTTPEFDLDEGEIKLIDQDESTLYFGLFEVDEVTGELGTKPTIIWSIEVSTDLQGGRQS